MWDRFTQEEHEKMVNNCKEIFNYLETEIKPKLRSSMHFSFNIEDGCKPLNLVLHPLCKNFISIYRSYPEYDPTHSNVFTYDKYMFVIIQNWQNIKHSCLDQIEKDIKSKEVLNNFNI